MPCHATPHALPCHNDNNRMIVTTIALTIFSWFCPHATSSFSQDGENGAAANNADASAADFGRVDTPSAAQPVVPVVDTAPDSAVGNAFADAVCAVKDRVNVTRMSAKITGSKTTGPKDMEASHVPTTRVGKHTVAAAGGMAAPGGVGHTDKGATCNVDSTASAINIYDNVAETVEADLELTLHEDIIRHSEMGNQMAEMQADLELTLQDFAWFKRMASDLGRWGDEALEVGDGSLIVGPIVAKEEEEEEEEEKEGGEGGGEGRRRRRRDGGGGRRGGGDLCSIIL